MISPFNSPLETGIRTLAILTAVFPRPLDLQHLVYFDYLVLHTGDVKGPRSLHTPLPLRSGELTVRRGLIERGIFLMMSRQLIERVVSLDGFQYIASESASAFLSMMSSQYILKLKDRAEWVARTFGESTLEELQALERSFFRQWSTQFHSVDRAGGQGI